MKTAVQQDISNETRSSAHLRWYVWAALALTVFRLWIQPMNSSFWLDETGTFLLVQGTFDQMLEKCVRWVGQPTFFTAIVWFFSQLPGPREIVLRLPSFFGLTVAAFFVYRIGKRVLGTEAAGSAMLIFAALAAYYASDARPYALAMMAASGALLFLIRWMAYERIADVVCYAFFAALTVYLHFLFAVMFAVHAAYVLLKIWQRSPPSLPVLALAISLVLVFLTPMVPGFLRVVSNRNTLSFGSDPRISALILDSVPGFLHGFLVAGLIAAILLFSHAKFSRPTVLEPEVWLFVFCAVASPLALFLISFLSPVQIFVARYLSVALPGLALALAWLISGFQPLPARTLITLALVGGAIVDRGGSLRNLRHKNEDWRGAMAAIKELNNVHPMPVLARSDFIESADPAKFADPGQAEFLLSPLFMYPPGGMIIPLSMRVDARSFERLETIVDQILLRGDRFVLVTSPDTRYQMWLKGRLHLSSFSNRSLGNFGTVSVDLFERNTVP